MIRSIFSAIALTAGGLALAAPTATEVRELDAFEEVVWEAAGELLVGQSRRERLSIEAEPAVLAKILALETRGSGAVRIAALSTPKLLLALNGSGDLQLAELSAHSLEVRLAGAGNVAVGGGQVDSQRVAIDGSGSYAALRLASRVAEVSIGGSGELLYRGQPQIAQSITGAGSVRPTGE